MLKWFFGRFTKWEIAWGKMVARLSDYITASRSIVTIFCFSTVKVPKNGQVINSAILEKYFELFKGLISNDIVNQILNMTNEFRNAIDELSAKCNVVLDEQKWIKDQMVLVSAEMMHNTEEMAALVNTIKKDPSSIAKIVRGILSGVQDIAALTTIIDTINPGMSTSSLKKIADLIMMFFK